MRLWSSLSDGAPSHRAASTVPRVLIGGVGYRWQRDASFGLVASDALAGLDWPPDIQVADLGYGAIYVAQDLADMQPSLRRLILLAGTQRGREPAQLTVYRDERAPASPEEIQARIREAGAGVVDLDHLLVIARHLEALPGDVLVIEVEPLDVLGGEGLSPQVERLLPEVMALVHREALAER